MDLPILRPRQPGGAAPCAWSGHRGWLRRTLAFIHVAAVGALPVACGRGAAPVTAATPAETGPRLSSGLFARVPPWDADRYWFRRQESRDSLRRIVEANERRWHAAALTDYEYAIRRPGGWEIGPPMFVRVVRGRPTVFDSTGTRLTLDAAWISEYTIDGLFAELRERLDDGAPYVQIVFDPELGYPTFFHLDYDMTDASSISIIRRFRRR